MIKKLKIFAIAMLVTGATVATTKATVTPPASTNALQAVTLNLTVYGEKTGVATAIFNTTDLINIVSNALGTNATIAKGATLGIATVLTYTNTSVSLTNTNGAPIFATNSVLANTIVLETNLVPAITLTNTNNFTIGNTAGNYLSFTGTNVSLITAGADGPTTNSVVIASNQIVLDANGNVTVGTNGTTIEDGVTASTNGALVSYDTNTVMIITNGGSTSNLIVGTNTVTITTNTVVIGGVTNTFGTNVVVEVGTSNAIVVSNGTATSGFGTNASFATTLTTVITTNIVVSGTTTNYQVITETTDDTNVVSITGYTITNVVEGGSALVIADKGTNFLIPPALLSITNEPSTNDVIATTTHATNGYSIKSMTLNYTNSAGSNLMYIKVQGLVKSTTDTLTLKVGTEHVPVQATAESWTDVSGYGFGTNAPIILGGTISVGAPAAQPGPKFTP